MQQHHGGGKDISRGLLRKGGLIDFQKNVDRGLTKQRAKNRGFLPNFGGFGEKVIAKEVSCNVWGKIEEASGGSGITTSPGSSSSGILRVPCKRKKKGLEKGEACRRKPPAENARQREFHSERRSLSLHLSRRQGKKKCETNGQVVRRLYMEC